MTKQYNNGSLDNNSPSFVTNHCLHITESVFHVRVTREGTTPTDVWSNEQQTSCQDAEYVVREMLVLLAVGDGKETSTAVST